MNSRGVPWQTPAYDDEVVFVALRRQHWKIGWHKFSVIYNGRVPERPRTVDGLMAKWKAVRKQEASQPPSPQPTQNARINGPVSMAVSQDRRFK